MAKKIPQVIKLKRFIDDRGSLDQIFNDDLPFTPKRAYFIISNKGVIRGMHGHKIEWKAIYVTKGSMKLVITDMELKETHTFTLSDKVAEMLVVPNNWYHGFTSLSDVAQVLILSSLTLDESKKDDYRLSFKEHKELLESFMVVDR